VPLENRNLTRLTAAEGYIELGMPMEANAELEEIDADAREVPEVLRLRVPIYRALEKWELLQTVAKRLAIYDPDDVEATRTWADATRRTDYNEAARLILLNAIDRHPHSAALHYDLARIECQLGDVSAARARLTQAFNCDAGLRLRALDDADLEPIWAEWPDVAK
jgi:thioredoxin-like negative regulator of GroEL